MLIDLVLVHSIGNASIMFVLFRNRHLQTQVQQLIFQVKQDKVKSERCLLVADPLNCKPLRMLNVSSHFLVEN